MFINWSRGLHEAGPEHAYARHVGLHIAEKELKGIKKWLILIENNENQLHKYL